MIDLHLHSTNSDGKLSVKELSGAVVEKNIKYCALTDHDNVDGVEEMRVVLRSLNPSIELINGVELTCRHKEGDIHVLAYDFDIISVKEILNERNQIVLNKKEVELAKSKEFFRENGFIIDEDLKTDDKLPVGLTVALNIYNNNKNLKLLFDRHGKILSNYEFYQAYQSSDASCYVEKSGVDVDWIIGKFTGIANNLILAHPFVTYNYFLTKLSRDDVSDLISKGINGLEIFHYGMTDNDLDFLKSFVKDKNLYFTGGSDFHSKGKDCDIGFYGDDLVISAFRLKNYSFE